ncbi:kinase-like domain-containing protein [Calycina marina]|uniref:non-specific serine/threonine protein kinase n=1 Tax=Calycina marina TaxID=1763456 RepID=A0A9P8CB86_9HELO|nr:kinase-like domain-containing protein [Calycina marina]
MASQERQTPSNLDLVAGLKAKPEANEHNENKTVQKSPVVRFASENEEIAPQQSLEPATSSSGVEGVGVDDNDKVKELAHTLAGSQLAERRMSCFNFELVSLPASRVPSNEDNSREASRHNTITSRRSSPQNSPRMRSMHSPPITPAATRSRDDGSVSKETKDVVAPAPLEKVDTPAFAPQISPPVTSPSTTLGDSRPGSSGVATKESSVGQEEPAAAPANHHGKFSIGPGSIGPSPGGSVPVSREPSPGRANNRLSAATLPSGDDHDPYSAKRRGQTLKKNVDAIEPRFKFQPLNSKSRNSTTNLPRSSASRSTEEKRSSRLFATSDTLPREDSSSSLGHKSHGSMANLTRFLHIGNSHKIPKEKRMTSPSPSFSGGNGLPFEDSHGLITKYGKFGKVLGAGAGGSVRIIKRSDGTTFAVKQFRARHQYETKKDYGKKVTAEFCVGSALHHGNIIETLDIINEKDTWYEVMEFAPYDLFAAVMTGKMSKEEVNCSFLQALSGVSFLHSSGLAHRDLKLDNIVVNEHGILKLIDFGSAFVFKYPFENGINLASGIVGSDPYLAPEVLDERKYDPQPADIWSLAIIFCCMSLRRFPWKNPRLTDNSYKLFASAPTPVTSSKNPSISEGSQSSPALGQEGQPEKKTEVIKGPFRLLRLLPKESRSIIGLMLQINPRNRAKMVDVVNNKWISGTDCCRQDLDGSIHRAPGHVHTLEPPTPSPESKK